MVALSRPLRVAASMSQQWKMDARCCAYIEERLGASAVCSDNPLKALSALAPYGAIVLWHAFEPTS